MPNMANATIIGHAGGDAEVRFDKQGKPVANFKVAVNTGYGEHKVCSWYKVVSFGKTAEWVGKSIKKGMAVAVSGELKMDEWTGKDGHKNFTPEISAHSVQSLEKGEKDGRTEGEKKADGNPDVPF